MFLHAIRNGLTYDEFKRDVLFFVMGDDLIYASKSHMFKPSSVAHTYRSCGLYLETNSLDLVPIERASFLGTTPVWREFGYTKFLLPLFRTRKILDSMLWKKRRSDTLDDFSKLVSCCLLLFADREEFEAARKEVFSWY